jgi:hypothetical protein
MNARTLLLTGLALAATIATASAGPAYQPPGRNPNALEYAGKAVSVNAEAGSLSVRGDSGFKTFKAARKQLGAVSVGDSVSVSYEAKEGRNEAISVSVTAKADGLTRSQKIAAEREKAKAEGEKKTSTRPAEERAGDDIGYSRGYYVPPDQR